MRPGEKEGKRKNEVGSEAREMGAHI